jgi:hypothetical protein
VEGNAGEVPAATRPAVQLNRRKLFDQVWKQPLRKLAQRYGISDVALGKACRRMQIPLPGPGHWAKRSAGKRVRRRPPLPRLPMTADEGMHVFRVKPRPVMRQESKLVAKAPSLKIPVAERLRNPHPLVANAREVLRAEPHHRWRTPHLDISVSQGQLSRALRIMDALIKALEKRGYSVSVERRVSRFAGGDLEGPAITVARIAEDPVAFRLVERMQENRSRSEEDWRAPRYLWTGRLKFEITDWWPAPAPRRTWSDGRRQRLEDFVGQIVEALKVAVERARQWRLEREEVWRKEEEERERKRGAERRRALEKARIEALERQVENWIRSRQLRDYVEMVRSRLEEVNDEAQRQELHDWLEWALAHATRLNPWPPATLGGETKA